MTFCTQRAAGINWCVHICIVIIQVPVRTCMYVLVHSLCTVRAQWVIPRGSRRPCLTSNPGQGDTCAWSALPGRGDTPSRDPP